MALFDFSSKSDPAAAARLIRVERKLDLIMQSLGLKYEDIGALGHAAQSAARNGNKIEAIKIHREAAKCGLKEAREAVEEWLVLNEKGG